MYRVLLSMIEQCMYCKAVIGGDGKPPVTHGVCQKCLNDPSKWDK